MIVNMFNMSTRDGVYNALIEVGRENENVVVLDADLCGSTKTVGFKNNFPSRFFDCGIAEGNMVGVAAGLSAVGKIPFAASFAMFVAGRAYEQIRNSVCYTNLNVKIIGSHCGFSSAEDGATHQCIEDIALMRATPNIMVVSPCDYVETLAVIRAAVKYKGPMYIRTSKFISESVNKLSYLESFDLKKGVVLKEGSVVGIVATGVEVSFALKAAELLEADGISVMVLNIHTIKPLDAQLILHIAKKVKFLFTVEEHSVVGGLGEAVASLLAEKFPIFVKKLGIKDEFGKSANALELLKLNGLDEVGIYKNIKDVVLNKEFYSSFSEMF